MKQRRSNQKHIGGQISSILFIPLDRARAETTLAGMDAAYGRFREIGTASGRCSPV